jgi:hypothetical protein
MTPETLSIAAGVCWGAGFAFSLLCGARVWRHAELAGYACVILGTLCLGAAILAGA